MFKARSKLKEETQEYALIRRLEEYIEYAESTKRFADIGFYKELIEHIEKTTDALKRIAYEPQACEEHYIKIAKYGLR